MHDIADDANDLTALQNQYRIRNREPPEKA